MKEMKNPWVCSHTEVLHSPIFLLSLELDIPARHSPIHCPPWISRGHFAAQLRRKAVAQSQGNSSALPHLHTSISPAGRRDCREQRCVCLGWECQLGPGETGQGMQERREEKEKEREKKMKVKRQLQRQRKRKEKGKKGGKRGGKGKKGKETQKLFLYLPMILCKNKAIFPRKVFPLMNTPFLPC